MVGLKDENLEKSLNEPQNLNFFQRSSIRSRHLLKDLLLYPVEERRARIAIFEAKLDFSFGSILYNHNLIV